MHAPSSDVEKAYARLAGHGKDMECTDEGVAACVDLILAIFDEFYARFRRYPLLAKKAFEDRDPHASIRVSSERLGLYSRYVAEHGPRMREYCPALSQHTGWWDAIEQLLLARIAQRYEADIIFGFTHSLRRNIDRGIWRPVAYDFPPPSHLRANSMAQVHVRLPVHGHIDLPLIRAALAIPGFAVPFRDLEADARRILSRLERQLYATQAGAEPVALDLVNAGFYRDRSAFLVGRWLLRDGTLRPFVVAFLNGPDGIHADAVLDEVADIHSLFSSALANLHVTTDLYYQTCVFLFSLMPRRPLGHHYATIGYNHVGKVVILQEIVAQLRASGSRLRRSPGMAGTVALGFTAGACDYHLKVIRDEPTAAYKWGAFPGVAAVLERYRVVHEINRAGSMLDNVMFFNVRLELGLFEPELIDEILRHAPSSVQLEGDGVIIRSLIVQLKIVPLPVYLQGATEQETHAVIRNLGHCIRNNAATNIFNRDLDCRNYGVGRYGRVLLFDYDAVEKLTDVKVRTNTDREPGEEGIPEWYFEEGTVFLPEELEYGMQLKGDYARRCFRSLNGDLATVEYWCGIQQRLLRGEVPELRMYPASARLEGVQR